MLWRAVLGPLWSRSSDAAWATSCWYTPGEVSQEAVKRKLNRSVNPPAEQPTAGWHRRSRSGRRRGRTSARRPGQFGAGLPFPHKLEGDARRIDDEDLAACLPTQIGHAQPIVGGRRTSESLFGLDDLGVGAEKRRGQA